MFGQRVNQASRYSQEFTLRNWWKTSSEVSCCCSCSCHKTGSRSQTDLALYGPFRPFDQPLRRSLEQLSPLPEWHVSPHHPEVRKRHLSKLLLKERPSWILGSPELNPISSTVALVRQVHPNIVSFSQMHAGSTHRLHRQQRYQPTEDCSMAEPSLAVQMVCCSSVAVGGSASVIPQVSLHTRSYPIILIPRPIPSPLRSTRVYICLVVIPSGFTPFASASAVLLLAWPSRFRPNRGTLIWIPQE